MKGVVDGVGGGLDAQEVDLRIRNVAIVCYQLLDDRADATAVVVDVDMGCHEFEQ